MPESNIPKEKASTQSNYSCCILAFLRETHKDVFFIMITIKLMQGTQPGPNLGLVQITYGLLESGLSQSLSSTIPNADYYVSAYLLISKIRKPNQSRPLKRRKRKAKS